MKLSEREQKERKAAFHQMSFPQKMEYIVAYYKFPIVMGLIGIIVLTSVAYRAATKKEAVLYVGYLNVSAGETANSLLTEDYLRFSGIDPDRKEVYVYSGLYLSDDPAAENHEYSYASRLKLMAAINARELDVVLMNREAYDILSANGYLLDLADTLGHSYPTQAVQLEPYLQTNDVVLEDNAIEYRLNEADEYQAVIQPVVNGINITDAPVPDHFGFSDTVTLGILANSPRVSEGINYAVYLCSDFS